MDLSAEAIAEGRVSANDLAALLKGNTYATLLVEYERTMVPLTKLAEPIFGLNADRAKQLAKADRLPLPVFKLGGVRAPWMVHLADLAKLVDVQRTAAIDAMEAREPIHEIDEAAA